MIASIFEDITERKQAESALKESEEKYRFLFENMTTGFTIQELIFDEYGVPSNYRFIDINSCYEKMSGFNRNEIIGKTIKEIAPDSRQEIINLFTKVGLTGEPVSFEYFSQSLNRHVRTNTFFVKKGIIASIIEDISERRQAEDALKESEEMYRLLVNTSPDAITVTDLYGNITYFSSAAIKLFGDFSETDILGHNISEWIVPEEMDKALESIQVLIEKGYPKYKEYTLLKKDETKFTGEINAAVIKTANCNPKGMILITRDITDRKIAEETLKASEKRLMEINATKDKFFSLIAHDLKSPLGNFQNILGLMAEEYDTFDENEKKEIIFEINKSAKNIFNLLENLLNWAGTQTGRIQFNPDFQDIDEIISKPVSILMGSAHNKNISVELELNVNSKAYIDVNMINTIIRNLFTNAIKFTNKSGKIIISSVELSDSFEISVTDNGVGMNEDYLSKLFRIDIAPSTLGTANERGTGLGLILCKEFSEKHGGSIKVVSEVGKGSKFTVIIPKI